MRKAKKGISKQVLESGISFCERRNLNFCSHQTEKELCSLNPGVHVKMIIRDYCRKKIETGLMALGIGSLVVLLCIGNVVMNGELSKGKYLEKESVGDGKKIVVLDAEIGEVKIKDILIEVEEKELSDDEIKEQLNIVKAALPKSILGENESLSHVNKPLNLINTWENTEIAIFWNSSNYGVLQEDGSLGKDNIPEEGIEVTLTALLSWKEVQTKECLTVRVFPIEKTQEEKLNERLLDLIEQEKVQTKPEDYIELPEMLDDTKIVWKEKKTETVFAVLGLVVVSVFAILWGQDQEIHKQYEKRNRQLLLDYPEFVSKLQLLVSSGMSIRSAFIRLGQEYQKGSNQRAEKKFLYEELLIVIRKMENGMGELEAYDDFTKRCDLICYKRLSAIILQNVKKGTEGLKDSLYSETQNAFAERKQIAKKMGEEAGTKLLLPMMMMMSIVLMIIVIPAYFSFGGI